MVFVQEVFIETSFGNQPQMNLDLHSVPRHQTFYKPCFSPPYISFCSKNHP